MTFRGSQKNNKRKKKDGSIIEKELIALLQAQLKAYLDKVLEDVLKDFQ